ncbi:septum site-determining protein MinC [Ammoniphilus oxalaticus]|uniref:Probable septum site-determining protein MinC n=1 Tax=Ammoniphilus oxalaticus TaxID=66863 RepID=A0A419SIX1_9BACL|nr:septum site-determining protein MinC [Ammoniphilus oxalaticus]RKD23899.1 septum site-determining protein MinC [Ammoniphilus oxalaticus]
MTMIKNIVTIKGKKDGLVFQLDDVCSLDELYAQLKEKVEHSHQQILSGPPVEITIELGNRYLNVEQEKELRDIIGLRPNLVVRTLESDVITKEQALLDKLASIMRVEIGTVRSGQELRSEGDLLLLGDINPGGCVYCAGSLFVMGALRGMAHAGCNGDEQAIIAASQLRPTQLRIADIISRPPDEWMDGNYEMEFAYLEEGQMSIDKLNQLHRLRSDYFRDKGALGNMGGI